MAVDVIMPQMGESIFEGTITKWLKKPGDKIERDEPLFEISTDKVDAEIPSPSAGVLKEIKVTEGQTVPIQTIVAVIDAAGAAAAPPAQAAPPKPLHRSRAESRRSAAPPAAARCAARASCCAPRLRRAAAACATTARRCAALPWSASIARENNIDLAQVPGTGAGGRVSKQDILAAVEGGPGSAAGCTPPLAAQPPASFRASASTGGAAALRRVLENRRAPREACTSAITKCSPCR